MTSPPGTGTAVKPADPKGLLLTRGFVIAERVATHSSILKYSYLSDNLLSHVSYRRSLRLLAWLVEYSH